MFYNLNEANDRPQWSPFVPRYSVPEGFQRALSYEGQIHWLAQWCAEVEEYVKGGGYAWVVDATDVFDLAGLKALPGQSHTFTVTTDVGKVNKDGDPVFAVVTCDGAPALVCGVLESADGSAWTVAVRHVLPDYQGAIDAEASARESADTALGARIDAEASARESADTALGARIDAIVIPAATPFTFATVDEMKVANLSAGDVAVTAGFHKAGMGGATYVVKASSDATANGMSRIALANDNVACACFTGSVTPSQLGYTAGAADTVLTELVAVAVSQDVTARLEGATYQVTGSLIIPSGVTLAGSGVNRSIIEQQTAGATTVKVQASTSSETYATGVTLRDFTVTYKAEEWRTDGSVGVDVLAGSYLVENVNVRYHATGFKIRALPGGDSYNPIVRLGENRLLNSCTVYGADTGIENAMQDGFMSNCAIGSTTTYGINNTGGLQLTNCHIWAFKQYGIANSATLDATNVMIESNPNSDADNTAWVRLWGGRANFVGLHVWNIQKPVGNLIYQNAGIANFTGMTITRCPGDNTSKTCPPIVYVGEASFACSIEFMIDDTYTSIKGSGYTNHGCTLSLAGVAPATSTVTQSFVTKTAGTYTVSRTTL